MHAPIRFPFRAPLIALRRQRGYPPIGRIHLNPGSAYGAGGAGHMRMNLATSRLLVRRALDNIAAAVAMA